MDCRGVADIANGEALLKILQSTIIFRRIVSRLVDLADRGWRPRKDVDSMVLWSPREYNTVPDHSINAAMDQDTGIVVLLF